jgi:hypothetical protein
LVALSTGASSGMSASSTTLPGTAGSSPRRSSSPPCGAKPIAAAIASRIVDLPLPLSPASNVTDWSSPSRSIVAIAGTLNGNFSPQRKRRKPST